MHAPKREKENILKKSNKIHSTHILKQDQQQHSGEIRLFE